MSSSDLTCVSHACTPPSEDELPLQIHDRNPSTRLHQIGSHKALLDTLYVLYLWLMLRWHFASVICCPCTHGWLSGPVLWLRLVMKPCAPRDILCYSIDMIEIARDLLLYQLGSHTSCSTPLYFVYLWLTLRWHFASVTCCLLRTWLAVWSCVVAAKNPLFRAIFCVDSIEFAFGVGGKRNVHIFLALVLKQQSESVKNELREVFVQPVARIVSLRLLA